MRADTPEEVVAPLHSVSSEQAVLGALLLDPTAWHSVADAITLEDFYRPDHRLIFAAISALASSGTPCDIVTVSQHLERANKLHEAGGLAYLSSIARNTPSAANAHTYADVVRDRGILRRLQALGTQIERSVLEDSDRSAVELIANAQAQLLDIQARSRKGSGLVSSQQLAGELIDDLDRRRERPLGLEIGLADFDGMTHGLEPGDLVVIAGRPGMGKTALLVSIAAHVSQAAAVAVFSAEMPAPQLMRRCVALVGDIAQGKLRRADQLTDSDWAAIAPAAGKIAGRRLWIDDTALPSLTHIRAECMALKARAGLGLVLVDYVQLVQGSGGNRYEQLRDVAYGCKALAKDLAGPVILLAQLNRGVEARDNKRPYMSDLRDSGAIEEAADIVGLLYSEGYYDPSFGMPYVLECRVEKHRNGDRGECLWRFSGAHSSVTALEPGPRAQYHQLRARQVQSRRREATNDL